MLGSSSKHNPRTLCAQRDRGHTCENDCRKPKAGSCVWSTPVGGSAGGTQKPRRSGKSHAWVRARQRSPASRQSDAAAVSQVAAGISSRRSLRSPHLSQWRSLRSPHTLSLASSNLTFRCFVIFSTMQTIGTSRTSRIIATTCISRIDDTTRSSPCGCSGFSGFLWRADYSLRRDRAGDSVKSE